MRDICSRGQDIYDRKYKGLYNEEARGKYAAIDIVSERIYVFESLLSLGSEVLSKAPQNAQLFVMRIGSPALFTMS